MRWVVLAQVIGTILAVLVATVPLFYPRYYRKQTQQAMDTLDEFTESAEVDLDRDRRDGSLEISWLTESDTGFRKVKNSIEKEAGESRYVWFEGLPHTIERIGIVKGSIHAIAEYFEIEDEYMTYGAGANYALFVEGTDGTQRIVAYDRFRPRTTQRHIQLQRWVRATANRRSQYATGILAVLWTTISTWTVVIG